MCSRCIVKPFSSNWLKLSIYFFMLGTYSTLVMIALWPCLHMINTFHTPYYGIVMLSKNLILVFLESSKLTRHFFVTWHMVLTTSVQIPSINASQFIIGCCHEKDKLRFGTIWASPYDLPEPLRTLLYLHSFLKWPYLWQVLLNQRQF